MSVSSGDFDPSVLARPAAWNDPYPIFRHLQHHAPACFSPAMGGWLLTRYDDVSAALRDPRLSSRRSSALADRLPDSAKAEGAVLARHLAQWALLMDPPDHARLRGLINKGFSATFVERMRPRIQALVDRLLDRVMGSGEFDVMAGLAIPLPLTIIGDLLGLPAGDYDRLRTWSNALGRFFGSHLTEDLFRGAAKAVIELESYFDKVIADRRARPRDDLVSALVAAEDEGRILDDQELRSTCVMLLFGGHETTTNLIGNGLYALLRHESERDRLMQSPELISSAVEEFLRFESPVQWQSRVVASPIELHGQSLARGSRVFLMLGAANRDPAQFQDPDRLDIARRNNRHLALGQGPHYCVGAPLGRLEGQIAIRTVLERFPRLRLVTATPEWTENPVLRGFKRLPIALS